MKKYKSGKKLSRTTKERRRLFRNMTRSLVGQGYIVTTVARAKAFRPNIEKLVSAARKQTLTSFRQVVGRTGDMDIARKLTHIGRVLAKRPGGYTRIMRLGSSRGDNAGLARLEWVVTIPGQKQEDDSKKVNEQSTTLEKNKKASTKSKSTRELTAKKSATKTRTTEDKSKKADKKEASK